jgi:hypothetical protein
MVLLIENATVSKLHQLSISLKKTEDGWCR